MISVRVAFDVLSLLIFSRRKAEGGGAVVAQSVGDSVEKAATNEPRIQEVIEDSLVLLDYLARRGDDVGHSTIDTIVGASRAYQDGGLSADKEAALWASFNQLSKAAAPATPETVRFSQRRAGDASTHGSSRKITYAVAGKYRTIAFIFFVLFVIFSAYWSAATASLKSVSQPKADSENDIIDNASSMRAIKILSLGVPYLLGNLELPPGGGSSKFAQSVTNDRFAINFMTGVADAVFAFVLPLVAGGLGASVYVVRAIAKEIEREAFSPRLTIRFDLRIYLGAIAGLVICRLFLADASGLVSTLTPIGIAFIAGYSIEVFFSFLDRFVGAFSADARK